MTAFLLVVRLVAAIAASAGATVPSGVAVVEGEARVLEPDELKTGRIEGAEAVWTWSAAMPPRRSEGGAIDPALFSAPPDELIVRVDGADGTGPIRLLAAPAAMWREVPEELLPQWPVPSSGRLALPRDSAADWRLRLVGPGTGSWWLDVAGSVTQVSLSAGAAPDRSFQVLAGDRVPVASARIEIGPRAAGLASVTWLAFRQADAAGKVTWPALPDRATMVIALAPEHPPLVVSGAVHELPEVLLLSPGLTLSGRVLDAAGRPLSDATVAAGSYAPGEEPIASVARAVTDDEGRWRIAGLVAGDLAVVVEREGYARRRESLTVQAADHDVGDWQLEAARRLELRTVSGLDGRPIAGASVSCDGLPLGRSNGSGTVHLNGLPPAPLRVRIEAEGHLDWIGTLAAADGFEEVTLQPSHRVIGRLLDHEGMAAAGGQARVETGDGFTVVSLAPDGTFALDLEPERPARLELTSTEARIGVEVPPGSAGEITDLGDLQAPAGMILVGRLVRRTDASPVAGAEVWAISAENPLLAWARSDRRSTTSDREGRFRLTGLPAIPQTVYVDAPSMARRDLPVAPQPGSDEIDVGVVELDTGSVVRVVTLEAAGASASIDLGGRWLEPEMLTAPVVGGRATLYGVPEGRYPLLVKRRGAVLCETEARVPPGPDEVEVECSVDERRVRGVVWSGERPVEGGRLIWRRAGGESMPGVVLRRSGPLGLQRDDVLWGRRPDVVVEIDAEGEFSTDQVHAGTWRVTLHDTEGGVSEPQTVELAAGGEERELQLRFAGAAIAGRVIDAEGRPVAGAQVVDRAGGAFAFSGPGGGFRLPATPGQLARLEALREAERSEVVEVSPLDVAEPVTLVLGAGDDDRITVRVVDAEGIPMPGALVFLDFAGRASSVATTGAAGELSVRSSTGTAFRAAAHGGGRWGFDAWRSADETAEIVLAEGGSLHLRARRAAEIAIDGPGGWELSQLLRRLGRPLALPADGELTIHGLPPGLYRIHTATESAFAEVAAGETERVELP